MTLVAKGWEEKAKNQGGNIHPAAPVESGGGKE